MADERDDFIVDYDLRKQSTSWWERQEKKRKEMETADESSAYDLEHGEGLTEGVDDTMEHEIYFYIEGWGTCYWKNREYTRFRREIKKFVRWLQKKLPQYKFSLSSYDSEGSDGLEFCISFDTDSDLSEEEISAIGNAIQEYEPESNLMTVMLFYPEIDDEELDLSNGEDMDSYEIDDVYDVYDEDDDYDDLDEDYNQGKKNISEGLSGNTTFMKFIHLNESKSR